jgi:mono/diheme cytochrome c family protein
LYRGRELWDEHCADCHAFGGGTPGHGFEAIPLTGPGHSGPDLKGYNTRPWIEAFLRNPGSPRFMGGAQLNEGMKPVAGTEQELRALTELVYAETGAKDVDRNLVESAESLFSDKDCDSCHYRDGTSENTGPNLKGRGTLPYVMDIIADSSDRRLYGEKSQMPRFADKLSPDDIAELARFVLIESAK